MRRLDVGTAISMVQRAIREAVALGRNYRHAAVLRRHLREHYGVAVVTGPGVLIGEALTVADRFRWVPLAVLLAMFLVAARGKAG